MKKAIYSIIATITTVFLLLSMLGGCDNKKSHRAHFIPLVIMKFITQLINIVAFSRENCKPKAVHRGEGAAQGGGEEEI